MGSAKIHIIPKANIEAAKSITFSGIRVAFVSVRSTGFLARHVWRASDWASFARRAATIPLGPWHAPPANSPCAARGGWLITGGASEIRALRCSRWPAPLRLNWAPAEIAATSFAEVIRFPADYVGMAMSGSFESAAHLSPMIASSSSMVPICLALLNSVWVMRHAGSAA